MSDKNERLAALMGIVPCDEWTPINFGSAGGAMLQKHCAHEVDRCYPITVVGNMNGAIGGCPNFDAWGRYGELQAYVRGLEVYTQDKIARWFEFNVDADVPAYFAALVGARDITPGILGDAILEVMG